MSFSKTRDGQVFQGLELPPDVPPQPAFVHLAVIAGPRGFPRYLGNQLGLPLRSPFVRGHLETPRLLAVRDHRIALGSLDVEIITMCLAAQLNDIHWRLSGRRT